jgi:acyl-CoA thioesterase FadM
MSLDTRHGEAPALREPEPIRYDQLVDVRFSDLDPYGHLSTKSYLEYVVAARCTFLWNRFQLTPDDCAKRGFAIFITRSETNYKKGVRSLGSVLVSSWLEPEATPGRITVPFVITAPARDCIYADGLLTAAVVDPRTRRRIALPEWARPLFYTVGPGR